MKLRYLGALAVAGAAAFASAPASAQGRDYVCVQNPQLYARSWIRLERIQNGQVVWGGTLPISAGQRREMRTGFGPVRYCWGRARADVAGGCQPGRTSFLPKGRCGGTYRGSPGGGAPGYGGPPGGGGPGYGGPRYGGPGYGGGGGTYGGGGGGTYGGGGGGTYGGGGGGTYGGGGGSGGRGSVACFTNQNQYRHTWFRVERVRGGAVVWAENFRVEAGQVGRRFVPFGYARWCWAARRRDVVNGCMPGKWRTVNRGGC